MKFFWISSYWLYLFVNYCFAFGLSVSNFISKDPEWSVLGTFSEILWKIFQIDNIEIWHKVFLKIVNNSVLYIQKSSEN